MSLNYEKPSMMVVLEVYEGSEYLYDILAVRYMYSQKDFDKLLGYVYTLINKQLAEHECYNDEDYSISALKFHGPTGNYYIQLKYKDYTSEPVLDESISYWFLKEYSQDDLSL